MTKKARVGACLGALAMGLGGCGGEAAPGLEWGGASAHLFIDGTIDGEALTYDLAGGSATAAQVTCEREYDVPVVGGVPDYSRAQFVEVKVSAMLEVDGVMRRLELELKQHDLRGDAPGAVVAVIPRVDDVSPASDEMWVDWEWHDPANDDATMFEQSAQTGEVTVHLVDGEAGEGGVMMLDGSGSVGVTGEVRWSATESVQFSLTAPCGENKVNEIVEGE